MVPSATVTQVASAITNVTLQAANSARKEIVIYNASTAVLYLKFGVTASSTSYTVQVAAGGTFTDSNYSGEIDGAWATANGFAYVTEVA